MDLDSKLAREKILNYDFKRGGIYDRSRNPLTIDGTKHQSTKGVAQSIYHSNNIFEEEDIRTGIFTKRYRYGLLNPYQNLGNCREFLFITKPDLNIYERSLGGNVGPKMRDELNSYRFWSDLEKKFPEVLSCLQISKPYSYDSGSIIDPFNHLLENTVQSNIDVPGISSEMIETPSNMYGVNFSYRGSSEASDDGFDFSLEFKDTKYLPVYNFFKAYEEYETLKHHGIIGPWLGHITNKVLHDQYCIYKFLTLEDMETIVYYAKYYGVKSKNLPRDAFSNVQFDNGLSYSIEFNAAFVEDMNPEILIDFNLLSYDFWVTRKHNINIYDTILDRVNMTPAQSAVVALEENNSNTYEVFGLNRRYYNESIMPINLNKTPGGFAYKLKWKGDDIL